MRILALTIFMVFAAALHAHAVVIRSSLDTQTPEPYRSTDVHLRFNSDIEPELSLFQLVSAGDRKQSLRFSRGRGRGEIVVRLPPLPPGEYALQYKVFAADGHLTEDIVKFFVHREER